jgi:putative membrane protein
MVRILVAWIANSLAILAVAYLLGAVSVASTRDAFLAGLLLTLVNAIVRPILVVLTLPLTVITLGLFYFVITGFCLWLTSYFIPGFAVHGVFMTIVASVLISLISTLITHVLRS